MVLNPQKLATSLGFWGCWVNVVDLTAKGACWHPAVGRQLMCCVLRCVSENVVSGFEGCCCYGGPMTRQVGALQHAAALVAFAGWHQHEGRCQ